MKILRGAGGGDTIKRIAVGQGEAGSADLSGLVAAKANEDIKVKAIGAYFLAHSPDLRARGHGQERAQGPRGEMLSMTPGNSHGILFPLLAKLAGFRADSVKWVTMDGAAMGPPLITGRVDGAPFFANHEARLQKQAQAQGITLKRIPRNDAGFDMYSLAVPAREDTIAKDPETLKAFLRGSIRGMKHAFAKENLEEGARILLKSNPGGGPRRRRRCRDRRQSLLDDRRGDEVARRPSASSSRRGSTACATSTPSTCSSSAACPVRTSTRTICSLSGNSWRSSSAAARSSAATCPRFSAPYPRRG